MIYIQSKLGRQYALDIIKIDESVNRTILDRIYKISGRKLAHKKFKDGELDNLMKNID